MSLRDRVCLITGAGSGIGRATALLLAKEGAPIGAISRTEEEIEEVVAEIRAAGGDAVAVRADIAQAGEIESAIDTVAKKFGRLDFVFANAGVNGVWASLERMTPEEWDQTISINLRGTFLTLKYAVPHLKVQGGSIVVNASINGTRVFSNTGATAYAATKAAQVAMVKMLALELAEHRIRINVICPGAIETEIEDNTDTRGTDGLGVPAEFPQGWHPLRGRPGTAEQVARVVRFLASADADHLTGTELYVDGGESLVGIKG